MRHPPVVANFGPRLAFLAHLRGFKSSGTDAVNFRSAGQNAFSFLSKSSIAFCRARSSLRWSRRSRSRSPFFTDARTRCAKSGVRRRGGRYLAIFPSQFGRRGRLQLESAPLAASLRRHEWYFLGKKR